MENLVPEGIRLVAQQGFGWVMFCFACAASVWIYKKGEDSRAESEKLKLELQEKRIVEQRETVKSLHEGTLANLKLAAAQEATVESRQALHQLVIQMERDMDRNNEAWKPQVAQIVSAISDIKSAVALLDGKLSQLLGRSQ